MLASGLLAAVVVPQHLVVVVLALLEVILSGLITIATLVIALRGTDTTFSRMRRCVVIDHIRATCG